MKELTIQKNVEYKIKVSKAWGGFRVYIKGGQWKEYTFCKKCKTLEECHQLFNKQHD